jgi:hypothetical protein
VADDPGERPVSQAQEDVSVPVEILRELRDLLDFSLAMLGDAEQADRLFGFTPAPAAIGEATESLSSLDALVGGEGRMELEQVAQAAESIGEIAQLIRLSAEGAPEEFASTIVDTLALSYVRDRWPLIGYVANLLKFVDDQIHLDRVWEFITDIPGYVGKYFDFELETEEDARVQSALLLLLAAAAAILQVKGRPHGVYETSGRIPNIEVLHGWSTVPASSNAPFPGLPPSPTPEADGISARMLSVAYRYVHSIGADQDLGGALFVTMAFVPRVHGGPGLWTSVSGEGELEATLSNGWQFTLGAGLADGVDYFLKFGGDDVFRLGGAAAGSLEARLERRDEADPGGVPVAAKELGPLRWRNFTFVLRVDEDGPVFLLRVPDAAIVVPPYESGLWSYIVPRGFRADFGLGVGVGPDGIFFEGGNGLRALLPVNINVLGVRIYHVMATFESEADGEDKAVLGFGVGLTVRFGQHVALSTDGLGVNLVWDTSNGARDAFTVTRRLPTSLGLVIDADEVKGGGFLFFDEPRNSYGGVFEIRIGSFSIKAFGLLTTRTNGDPSLIVVLSGEIPEPVTGPFGFQLLGIGGLLGIHHRLDVEALQANIRGGVADQLLFPTDPVASAPRILATLGTVFPPALDHSVWGPMVKIAWGSKNLATLSVAVIVEQPDPIRILILGEFELKAPHEKLMVLLIHAEFAGVIDFERPSFEFDAIISKSRLGPYPLSGDIAARFHGDDEGLLLLTAGGFHPQFQVPTNANLPALKRITVALSSGNNPRARLELYTAVTSSTFQIGGKLEVAASAAGLTAEARLSLDAIFGEIVVNGVARCGFVAEIEGRAAIKRGSTTIAGVGLTIILSGTEPWHVDGKATISFFFFSVSIPFHGTFGDEPDRDALPLIDAAAMLAAALGDPASWETALPRSVGPLVTLGGRPAAAGVVVAHPLGRLALRQHVLPLGIDLTRVGGARTTPDRFEVQSVTVDGAEAADRAALRSPFAAGQFLDLGEDERFSRPAFEPMVSGFEVGPGGVRFGPASPADLRYEEIAIGPDGPLEEPRPGRPPLRRVFLHAATLGAAATTTLRRDERPAGERSDADAIRLSDVRATIVDAETLQPVDVVGTSRAVTYTELAQALRRHVDDGGAAPGSLVVVGRHEAGGG